MSSWRTRRSMTKRPCDPMTRKESLMWAAGLFDGEGCITSRKKDKACLNLCLAMTDEDSVIKFHQVVGVGNVTIKNSPSMKIKGWKTAWVWNTSGFENVQFVVASLWEGLSLRRKSRYKDLLSVYNAKRSQTFHHLGRGDIVDLKQMLNSGTSRRDAAKRFGVTPTAIHLRMKRERDSQQAPM